MIWWGYASRGMAVWEGTMVTFRGSHFTDFLIFWSKIRFLGQICAFWKQMRGLTPDELSLPRHREGGGGIQNFRLKERDSRGGSAGPYLK